MLSASGLLSMPHWASDPRCERPYHRPGRYPAQTEGAIAHTIAGDSIPCERRLGDLATRRLGDFGDSANWRLGDSETEPAGSRASPRARRSRRGVPPSRPSPTAKDSPQPPSRRAGRRRRLGRRCLGAGPVDRRRGHQHYRYGWVGGKRRTRRRPSCRFRSRLGCLSNALAPALAHLHQHYWYRYVQTPADSRSSIGPPLAPGSAASARRPAPIALVRWRRRRVEVGPGKP